MELKLYDVQSLRKQFRRSHLSAFEILDSGNAMNDVCEEFLSFQARFEELTGLVKTGQKTTVATRIAISTLWSDLTTRRILTKFFSEISEMELVSFASIHGLLNEDLVHIAENLAEWFVDESLDAIPVEFSTIALLTGRPFTHKAEVLPLQVKLEEFVDSKESLTARAAYAF